MRIRAAIPRNITIFSLFITLILASALSYMALGPETPKAFAQGILPSGAFGFSLSKVPSPADKTAGALLGVMNFDGAGGVSGSFTSYFPANDPRLQTGTLTGTYSSNADGTGSIDVTLSTGQGVQLAMVITDSGSRILLMATDSGTNVMSGTASMQ